MGSGKTIQEGTTSPNEATCLSPRRAKPSVWLLRKQESRKEENPDCLDFCLRRNDTSPPFLRLKCYDPCIRQKHYPKSHRQRNSPMLCALWMGDVGKAGRVPGRWQSSGLPPIALPRSKLGAVPSVGEGVLRRIGETRGCWRFFNRWNFYPCSLKKFAKYRKRLNYWQVRHRR